jgi:hypothetical protein
MTATTTAPTPRTRRCQMTPPLLRRSAAIGAAAVLPALLLAAPASAAPPERFVDEFSFDVVIEDFCDVAGLDIRSVGTFTGNVRLFSRGDQPLPYFWQRSHVERTLTNEATGAFVTERTSVLEKDLTITDNGDGTFTAIALLTGPSSLYDSSGRAIARDPGQTRLRIEIDAEGNGEVVEVVKGSTGRSDDYCEAMLPIIG